MKSELPVGHGLSQSSCDALTFKAANGVPSLSDVQHAALTAGVGRGESLLVVSPTSTGKTQIGLWAIASGLEAGSKTVYLVTHRALAKQKFEDFKHLLLNSHLDGAGSALVVATGDYIEDADGAPPADPLQASLLVATYEKYLGLLSASGTPTDMRGTVVVCDEIQLIGDENRGQNVEILLTLLRNAGWKQFVGLSAVLEKRDADDLADWLGISLIREQAREKHLRYECWTPTEIHGVSSERPGLIQRTARPAGVEHSALSALLHLFGLKPPPLPVIVFCMTKGKTYELAGKFAELRANGKKGQMSLAFDGLPATSANTFLSKILDLRVACHNADLLEAERDIVEQQLASGKLDVVFATSTLAAGVNFPLGAAIFADWERWNGDRREYIAIDSSEFHNMAGRVGRMGFAHAEGRVIYLAAGAKIRQALGYLELGQLPSIASRITPNRFKQLTLQIIASGICTSLPEVTDLICSTFSAQREGVQNAKAFAGWPTSISSAVDVLCSERLVVRAGSGKLVATPVGKAVGHSGLLPETGAFLLSYLGREAGHLSSLLPSAGAAGDVEQLSFLLFSACFSSPEFTRQNGIVPTRFFPWQLGKGTLFDPSSYQDHLAERIWLADIVPINAAFLSRLWIDGAELSALENQLPDLTAGSLGDLYRNLAWALQGLASIAAAATDRRDPFFTGEVANAVCKLPRAIRRLSHRVQVGLPDDALWLKSLCPTGAPFSLARHEMMQLRSFDLATPQKLMVGSKDADEGRAKVFAKAKPSAQAKANWVRDASRDWKINERRRTSERLTKRAKRCPQVDLINRFFSAKGEVFEHIFEEVLSYLRIDFDRLDSKDKTGAPDYLVKIKDRPALVIELKSKQGDNLVDYNSAVEVLAASEVHGHKALFCVTLCHPGVDPAVPSVIVACGRLSVVESSDLGEAFLRLCEGAVSHEQFWGWLATPGQATSADLPYREDA